MDTGKVVIWVIFACIIGGIFFALPSEIGNINLGGLQLQKIMLIGLIAILIIGVVKIAK